jgi:hypothetical protein
VTLILFLGMAVFLLVRSGELRVWQVAVVGLLGVELGRSHVADSIVTFTVQVFGILTNAH